MHIPIDFQKVIPSDPLLKVLIKYFWILKSRQPLKINHKLFPVNNIDIVFDINNQIKILDNGNIYKPKGLFFPGIKDVYYNQIQSSKIDIFGISFFPNGLYPLLKKPIRDFKNINVNMNDLLKDFTHRVEDLLSSLLPLNLKVNKLEQLLLQHLDLSLIQPTKEVNILKVFNNKRDLNIKDFTNEYGVHPRTLERMFNKYIGTSPKSFNRIKRSRTALNSLQMGRYNTLTEVCNDCGYYDQAHFIREFKKFSGSSPTKFLKENSSLLSLIV